MLYNSCDVVKHFDTVTEVGVFACFYTSIGVPAIVKFIVTPELFCTKHRALAVGSATVWTRIGGECASLATKNTGRGADLFQHTVVSCVVLFARPLPCPS